MSESKRNSLAYTLKRKRDTDNNETKLDPEIHKVLEECPAICQERGNACFLKLIQPKADRCDFDFLVDSMAGLSKGNWVRMKGYKKMMVPSAVHSKIALVRKFNRSLLNIDLKETVFLFLTRLSVTTLFELLYSGFVLFAQSLHNSDEAIDKTVGHNSVNFDNGILCLEIGGNRMDGTDDYGSGGRIVLDEIDFLTVGKKTVQSVCDVGEFDQNIRNNRIPYKLEVSFCSNRGLFVWDACIRQHGIDWMGLPCCRSLYDAAWRQQELSDVDNRKGKLVSICLVDSRDEKIVSGEVGYLVGGAYSCYSYYFDKNSPRADRVRRNACILWLARHGVKIFDVGTTAQNYVSLSGFHRINRLEFLKCWRNARSLEAGTSMLTPCCSVKTLLSAHRSRRSAVL